MKLQEILDLIDSDSKIDNSALDRESIAIPYIHSRWYRIFTDELRAFRGLDSEFKIMKRDKFLYYTGKASDEVYRENPLDHRVLKGDLEIFMDADPDLSRISTQLELQKIKIKAIEEFLKQISQRSFNIKNAIEFMKFKNGQ